MKASRCMPTLHHWHRSCEEASQDTSWNAEQEALSTVDVLTAFAAFTETSAGQTCRPTVLPLASKSGRGAMLDLRGLWHPCAVPGGGAGGCIVANDLVMGARCAAPHLKSLLYSKVLPTEIQHVRILVNFLKRVIVQVQGCRLSTHSAAHWPKHGRCALYNFNGCKL
jgi:hypothetical protein